MPRESTAKRRAVRDREPKKVRYGVVGLGYISQAAVLPAFAHAKANSTLSALISDDPVKLRKLSRKYEVEATYSYEEFGDCLESGEIDAVFIALPNHLHREYTVRAARAGVHVLCEKPMAVTEAECRHMIEAARRGGVKLMIAYRLHFEEASLKAIDVVQKGKLGEPRLFDSVFSMRVEPGNIRLRPEMGGGTLYDIGIYCINAARSLFRAEPLRAVALSASRGDDGFAGVDQTTSAVLEFPGDRLATFTTCFDGADVGRYQVVGKRGSLTVDPAFSFSKALKHELRIGKTVRRRTFRARDQFAPELLYFSDCVLRDSEPEPSGEEGLADVRIIEALYRSASRGGAPVEIEPVSKEARPDMEQEMELPPVRQQELVHAAPPEGA